MTSFKAPTTSYLTQRILTHHGPHLDELTAYADVLLHGLNYFPGANKAPWVFTNAGSDQYLKMDGRQALSAGYLPLGVLDNCPFNEHATIGGDRKPQECAASLMAKYLGSWHNPCWRRLVNKVKADDLEGDKPALGFSAELAIRFQLEPGNIGGIIKEFVERLVNVYYAQELLIKRDGDRAKPNFGWKKLPAACGKTINVLRVESDSRNLIRYTTTYLEPQRRPDVTIQRNSTGHVQIHTNYASQLNLDELAEFVRRAEAEKRGIKLPENPALLRIEGNGVPGVGMWGYLQKMKKLFNGGISALTAEPTKLTDGEITDLIFRHIQREVVEPVT